MGATVIEPLSYSSSNDLLGCQQRYVFRKVQKVDIDSDAPRDTLAMDIGSTLHKCMEDRKHDLTGFPIETLIDQMVRHNVPEEHIPMLWAMLRKYKKLHEQVGLKCVATEIQIKTAYFIGFVDLILMEPDGGWWIADLKTAASLSKFLAPRLQADRQLNLYSHFFPQIPTEEIPVQGLELPNEMFRGCRYRVVTKTRMKPKEGDSVAKTSDRMFKSVSAHEFVVPSQIMDTTFIARDFGTLRKLQTQLWKGTKKPIRNYNYCDSYFRPCEYWSRCHGAEYSEAPRVTEVKV